MTVLVFGKTGQVATELARVGGDQVICLGRAEADLSDPEACAAVVRETDASDLEMVLLGGTCTQISTP